VDGRIRGLSLVYGTSTSPDSTGETEATAEKSPVPAGDANGHSQTHIRRSRIVLIRSMSGSEIAVTLRLRTRRSTSFQSRYRSTPVSIPTSWFNAWLPAQCFDHRSTVNSQPRHSRSLPGDGANYRQRFNCQVYKHMRSWFGMLEAATAGAQPSNIKSIRSNWAQKYRGPTRL
jgi:hemolysin activation/secretion protein